ncbi:MAG TPA: hypothetical protein VKA80_05840 [Beijerinckiaceae bacterium]|nr:hypothetical protein [Beijerinckiaceae bacterium]
MIRCVRLDDLHVVARDHEPYCVREWLDRRVDGHELIPLAPHRAKEESSALTELCGPIPAQLLDERALRVHIADLPLEQPTEPRLPQPGARRPEQEEMADLARERPMIEQRPLHDEAAHAVRGDRDRLTAIERRKRERRTQAQGQGVEAWIGRP